MKNKAMKNKDVLKFINEIQDGRSYFNNQFSITRGNEHWNCERIPTFVLRACIKSDPYDLAPLYCYDRIRICHDHHIWFFPNKVEVVEFVDSFLSGKECWRPKDIFTGKEIRKLKGIRKEFEKADKRAREREASCFIN